MLALSCVDNTRHEHNSLLSERGGDQPPRPPPFFDPPSSSIGAAAPKCSPSHKVGQARGTMMKLRIHVLVLECLVGWESALETSPVFTPRHKSKSA